jgi:UDP-galactopyranose mutase
MLCTDYKDIISDIDYKKIFVTWPIDEFFDYKYWKLDYRNTLFKFETYDKNEFQKSTVINYPNDYEYTRITEFKKFYPINPNNKLEKTVICKEIPWIWEINAYPVENKVNLDILWKYLMESKNNKNTYFFWRLANFKYFDMDMTIKNILDSNI